MNQDTVITVENLSKSYKLYDASTDRMKEALHPFKKKYHQEFYALNNINFEVKRGETVGIIGKNGAGKSTLLKIITGVLTPSQGVVSVKGRVSALLELGAGFNMDYTGINNIFFQGSLLGIHREEMLMKMDKILAFADIGEFINQPVKIYSSGMFARLAFAVAIHVDPDILIVDEALSVGDANFQIKCHQRMDQLRENGVSILFVSHDTYSVKTLCSRAIFLKQGIQTSYGHALDVVNDYLLSLDNELPKALPLQPEPTPTTTQNPAQIFSVYPLHYPLSEPGVINITSGTSLSIHIDYEIHHSDLDAVVVVFNLYRARDEVYICGTTTRMDGLEPIPVTLGKHAIELTLQTLPLLSGKYRLRIALNEKKGIGIITELNDALIINVLDNHEAEGLLSLKRTWSICKT